MQKPRPLPTRPGHRAGSEREPGRVRAGVRGLSSVRGAPSELGDQEAAHAGLPCTAPVRPHKASGLDVRLRGGSGHEGPRGSPRVPGHAGGVPVALSCSACRLVFLRVGGARAWMGAACVGSASRFPARGNAAARAGRGEPGSHSHCGLQTPAPGPRGGRDRPGLVPSRAGPPRTGD